MNQNKLVELLNAMGEDCNYIVDTEQTTQPIFYVLLYDYIKISVVNKNYFEYNNPLAVENFLELIQQCPNHFIKGSFLQYYQLEDCLCYYSYLSR